MPIEKIGAGSAVSRSAFDAILAEWFQTGENQIGDADHGITAWVHVREGDDVFRLNSDTTREGVERYLQLVRQYEDRLEWSVVENERGNMNKVAFGPEAETIRYFYLYKCLRLSP
jgi:hypothetical protein